MKNRFTYSIILFLCSQFGFSQSLSPYTGPALKPSPPVGGSLVNGGSNCPGGMLTLSQTYNVAFTANSLSCSSGGFHADNTYQRVFKLKNALDLSSVEIGVETASSTSGSQPITVRIYEHTGAAFPGGTLTALASTSVNIPDQNLSLYNVPIAAHLKANTQIVLELFTPDGVSVNNNFFLGASDGGETGTAYLTAPGCSISTPTPIAALGFPNRHFIMNLMGCEPGFTFPARASISLDGIDDFLEIPSAVGNFDFNEDFTVSSWVKIPSSLQPDSATIDNSIIEKWSFNDFRYPFVLRYVNHKGGSNYGKISVARYDGTNNPSALSSMTLNDDKWHHLAFTKEGSALKLYIDGNLDQTFTDNTAALTSNSSGIFIGRRGNGTNKFRGQIDELRIRSVALNDSLIKRDMFLNLKSTANLSGAFSFDDGLPNRDNTSKTTSTNLTGANHATLNNLDLRRSLSNFTTGINKIYVNDDAAGANNGSSWADAFTDLQDALIPASPTNEIWVAAGTYKPTNTADRTISFNIPDSVKVYGGFAGNESNAYDLSLRVFSANETILSGNIGNLADSSDNTHHVVFTQYVSSETTVDGFTITEGNAYGGSYAESGGGWLNDGSGSGKSSEPILRNLIFINNAAVYGGGMDNEGDEGGNASPTLINCMFKQNRVGDSGGAVYNYGDDGVSSPIFTNCSFSNNYSGDDGGAIYNEGDNDGVSSPIFTNCSFTNNYAESDGGAIYMFGDGGDISGTFLNCVFNNNGSNHIGYDDGNANTQPHFRNCTFYGATTSAIDIKFFDSGQTPIDFTNCIFWNNNGDIVDNDAAVNMQYSLVDEAAYVSMPNHVFMTDPLFKNVAGGDFSLKPCSPAIDKGLNAGAPALDFLGEPRIFGCITADVGAYEYQGLYRTFAFDLNGVSIDDSGVGSSSTFYGTPIIASDKILKPGVKTLYKAPGSIQLNPGFKAEAVQAFETEIGTETCP